MRCSSRAATTVLLTKLSRPFPDNSDLHPCTEAGGVSPAMLLRVSHQTTHMRWVGRPTPLSTLTISVSTLPSFNLPHTRTHARTHTRTHTHAHTHTHNNNNNVRRLEIGFPHHGGDATKPREHRTNDERRTANGERARKRRRTATAVGVAFKERSSVHCQPLTHSLTVTHSHSQSLTVTHFDVVDMRSGAVRSPALREVASSRTRGRLCLRVCLKLLLCPTEQRKKASSCVGCYPGYCCGGGDVMGVCWESQVGGRHAVEEACSDMHAARIIP